MNDIVFSKRASAIAHEALKGKDPTTYDALLALGAMRDDDDLIGATLVLYAYERRLSAIDIIRTVIDHKRGCQTTGDDDTTLTLKWLHGKLLAFDRPCEANRLAVAEATKAAEAWLNRNAPDNILDHLQERGL